MKKRHLRLDKADEQAALLRNSAQYLLAHRGRRAVLLAPGAFFGTGKLARLLFDVTILSRIAGIKFALTYELPPPLTGQGSGAGPISDAAMRELENAASAAKTEIEKLLAYDTEMIEGIKHTSTMNLEAHRRGVVKQRDLGWRGEVKAIKPADMKGLKQAAIVIVPPLGFGPGRRRYFLGAASAALAFAKAWKAHKLIAFCKKADFSRLAAPSYVVNEAKKLAQETGSRSLKSLLEMGVAALDGGVDRVHLISESGDNGLLPELLTSNYKHASMLSKDRFDNIGRAGLMDIPSIMALIKPGVDDGSLLPRTYEDIEASIGNYHVIKLDSSVVACVCLTYHRGCAELSCLAVSDEHRNRDYGQLLLDYVEKRVRARKIKRLVALSSRATDWFEERGFALAASRVLPPDMRASQARRNSHILLKKITAAPAR